VIVTCGETVLAVLQNGPHAGLLGALDDQMGDGQVGGGQTTMPEQDPLVVALPARGGAVRV
jgi:hypothetical protein